MKTTLFYAIAGVMLIRCFFSQYFCGKQVGKLPRCGYIKTTTPSTVDESAWQSAACAELPSTLSSVSKSSAGLSAISKSTLSAVSVRVALAIQYNAPTTITQNSQSYSWVNGDPASASISQFNLYFY